MFKGKKLPKEMKENYKSKLKQEQKVRMESFPFLYFRFSFFMKNQTFAKKSGRIQMGLQKG